VAAALANLDTPNFRAWLRTAHCHPGRDRTVYPNSQLADIVRKPRTASTTAWPRERRGRGEESPIISAVCGRGNGKFVAADQPVM
jgi:hypothetical protein